jgi:hypothetical protein
VSIALFLRVHTTTAQIHPPLKLRVKAGSCKGAMPFTLKLERREADKNKTLEIRLLEATKLLLAGLLEQLRRSNWLSYKVGQLASGLVRMCVNNTGRRKYPWFCGNYLGM